MKHSKFIEKLTLAKSVYESYEQSNDWLEVSKKHGLSSVLAAGSMGAFYQRNKDKVCSMWATLDHSTALRFMKECPARTVDELKVWLFEQIGVQDKITGYKIKFNQRRVRTMLECIPDWKEGEDWFEQQKVGEKDTKLYIHWKHNPQQRKAA